MTNNDIVLLADPESNAWKMAEEICRIIKEKMGCRIVAVKIKKFRNNEKKIKISENIRKHDCFLIQDSSKLPESWFLETLASLEALKNSSAGEVTAVLPLLLYSRQDRKDESRVAVTAKLVADCISMYANRVLTVDLHAAQIQGFFDVPLDNLYSFPVVVNYLKEKYPDFLENLTIAATDAGGAKLAYSFAKRLEKYGIKPEIAIGSKHRPKEGEVSEFKMIGEIKDRNVFIVDDIIDSGNTIARCAEVIRKGGAKKIYVYGTHGLFTEGFDIFKDVDKIFVSDTVNQASDKVEIISMNPLIAEAILRIATGDSLSQLFD